MENLYKKDSKGNILIWRADILQNLSGISISITHGELDGKLSSNTRCNIQGKNKGKFNETSPYIQADKEVVALYKRKKRQGYKSLEDLKYNETGNIFTLDENIEEFLYKNLKFNTTDLEGNLKPMKCQQYYRSKKTWTDPTGKVWEDRKYYYLTNYNEPKEKGAIIIKFPCYIQPKINGVRATISLDETGLVQILSKEGLRYELPHIEQVFQERSDIFTITAYDGSEEEIIFDGELFIYEEKLQVISSAIKKNNFNTFRVKFLCFDLAVPNMKTLQRLVLLKELLNFTTYNLNCPIERVVSKSISNDKDVQNYTNAYIKQGHEGSILRDPTAYYAFGKRPMQIVKLKRVINNEFKIIDVISQDKNPELGLYVCRTIEGKEFQVTPTGDKTFKEILLYQKHLYIGKMLTCTFYEYTEDKKPFHVIENIVRDYE